MKLALFIAACSITMAQPLRLESTISLPGVNGRIDHLAVDVPGQRVFVSALGNNTVEVVDLKTGRVVHTIRGLKQPQGVLFVPEVQRLYVANGDDGHVRVYDGASFEQIQE